MKNLTILIIFILQPKLNIHPTNFQSDIAQNTLENAIFFI